jgi:hypothetical protein
MRGSDKRPGELFSYVDLEQRVRADHPLRVIRALTDTALEALSGDFAALYSGLGRPSIAPEMLLRAMLLQAFYSVRSERQLMERLEFDLLFRWFVGIGVDDPVWDHSTFSKNPCAGHASFLRVTRSRGRASGQLKDFQQGGRRKVERLVAAPLAPANAGTVFSAGRSASSAQVLKLVSAPRERERSGRAPPGASRCRSRRNCARFQAADADAARPAAPSRRLK